MKLVVRLFFFFFVSILMSPSLMSQSQRQINEQLAHGFFNNKDYLSDYFTLKIFKVIKNWFDK